MSSRSVRFTFITIWKFQQLSTLWSQAHKLKNLIDCHRSERNIWNNLLAATDFNQQGQVVNGEFNDLVITIIECDICSDEGPQNEWITDLFGLHRIYEALLGETI